MAPRSEQADRQGRTSVQHATRAADSAAHQAASELSQPSTQNVQAAVMNPQQASPAQLQEIQRLYGNRAVQRLLGAPADPPPPHEQNSQPMVSRTSLAGSMQGGALDPRSQSQIDSARGGGSPLDAGVGAQVGGALGADFSGVKVHTDPQSDALNRSLSAKAFTTGSDIFFSRGAYQPGSAGGKQLLAHELTHVVQQGSAKPNKASSEHGGRVQTKRALAGPDGGRRAAGRNKVQTKHISRSSQRTLQRYTEIGPDALEAESRDLAPIWMSEGNKFFRRAAAERELWAENPEIEGAKAITAHKDGILDIAAGETRTVSGKKYYRVVVSNRAEGAVKGATGGSKAPVGARPSSASEPFEKILAILSTHGRGTLGELIAQTKGTFNPYPYGTYANGAFEAIRTQFGLEIGKQIDAAPGGKADKTDARKLEAYLNSWRDRIGVVNSEAAHKFQFMVTECGGFSRMVSPGEEGTQATVEAGGRMRMDVDEDIPGPWRNHYAAVIMTDGPDRVTLESAAGMDKWWFGMYGSRSLDQTFIVKTLLAKLDIGTAGGEAGSSDAANYVRARLAGDEEAARASAVKLKEGLQAHLDGLLVEAGTKSKPAPKVAAVVQPGKALADRAAAQLSTLRTLRTKLMSLLLLPALTKEQKALVTEFTELAIDQVNLEFKSLMAATQEELGALAARLKAERIPLSRSVNNSAGVIVINEFQNLQKEKKKWWSSDDAMATFQSRMDLAKGFANTFADLAWLPDMKAAVVTPDVGSSAVSGGGGVVSSSPPTDSSSKKEVASESGTPPIKKEVSPDSSTPPLSGPVVSGKAEASVSVDPRGSVPIALHAVPMNPEIDLFLGTIAPDWETDARPERRAPEGMIVSPGAGVMLGEASKAKDMAPVSGPIPLPGSLRFNTNNGHGARCFIYSIVMGLTGLAQSAVEAAVGEIAGRANVGGGWIASDSGTALAVISEVERMFGIRIQVIELQNSDRGLQISGRSHNAATAARRPVVIRNTGAHYDAII